MNENAPIEYAPPGPNYKRRRLVKQIIFIIGCVILLSVSVCAVSVVNSLRRHQTTVVRTPSQLRQIGEAIQAYAADHEGHYPPGFATLLDTQQLPPQIFVCPNSDDDPAVGGTQAEILADFARPGRCSFIYVGADLSSPINPEAVIAFDDPEHEDGYTNILYGDGHVDSGDLPGLIHILENLEAGRNPARSPVTMTLDEAARLYEQKWRQRIGEMKTGRLRMPATLPVE